jgi:hypothetical protein
LYDCAGQLITYPAMMAPVHGGWVAIDTSDAQVRAVIELQIPATDPLVSANQAPTLQLRVGSALPMDPSRVRIGELSCHFVVPENGECRVPQSDAKQCLYGVPKERCYYPVRAEFSLDEVPLLDDMVVLRVGDSQTHVLAFQQP